MDTIEIIISTIFSIAIVYLQVLLLSIFSIGFPQNGYVIMTKSRIKACGERIKEAVADSICFSVCSNISKTHVSGLPVSNCGTY